MQRFHPLRPEDLLRLLAALLILKVTFSIVSVYPAYFPPDFAADFLQGRKAEFFGGYAVAFYTHIVTGPMTLLLGLVLMSPRIRRRFPRGHARLGRLQVLLILLLLTPSGLWMAPYAQTGNLGRTGFAVLALATGLTAWQGWRAAVARRFGEHERWMGRCYVLLCSAVVLRLIAGAQTLTGMEADWTYPLAAWASWLVPLTVWETIHRRRGTDRKPLVVRPGHESP